jgi:alkylation response protein AidB-like acyl-CoA dehydrogenase
MPRALSEEQEMIRDLARRFSDNEIAPIAQEIDRTGHIPAELNRKAAELSFFGLYTPEEYGGIGQNLTNACLVLEQIGRASPGYAGMLNVQIVICPAALTVAGTGEQKRRFLTSTAVGKNTLAFSVSELAGARNRGDHQTRITADGNGYRVNGAKIFCTLGDAQYILVLGRTERDGDAGYGWAIVDRTMEGVQIAPANPMLGWNGTENCSIDFEDVWIPADNILGDLLRADLSEANWASNIGHSAASVGAAQGLFEKTVACVKERTLYGRPMDRLQPISYRLAEAYSTLQACRALLYQTTKQWDAGGRNRAIASVCKAWICDRAFDITHELLQMWGGSGIMNSTGVNRYFRDARASMVAEGPSDLHYDYVAAYLLDRPADAAAAR